jgi:hypothetical protein
MYRSPKDVMLFPYHRSLIKSIRRQPAKLLAGFGALLLVVVILVPTVSAASQNGVAAAKIRAARAVDSGGSVTTVATASRVTVFSKPDERTVPADTNSPTGARAGTTNNTSIKTTKVLPGTGTPSTPVLGVLEADPSLMSADAAAGISFATLNLSWAEWEPQAGVFNTGYRRTVVAAADEYRAGGWKIAIDPGLQQPPAWALALPGGRLTDQFGASAPTADFEFSAAVRAAAARYITTVVQSVGPMNDYRVGLSENGEAYYPSASKNRWWAFTPQAQGSAVGLPRGVGVTPMVGWVPGTSTWAGSSVTHAQVSTWYDWYFGALVKALRWEINTYRAAGYGGQLELVMPGMGGLPAFYSERLAADLAPGSEDSFSTLNDGAVWWKLLDDLGAATLANTAIDDSSVYDTSGNPRGNACETTDASVNIDSSEIWSWSDTRWLAYLAKAHNLPIMGETPGNTTVSELPGELSLMRSCHLTALQWAWDYTLGESGGVSRAQLAAAFADYL